MPFKNKKIFKKLFLLLLIIAMVCTLIICFEFKMHEKEIEVLIHRTLHSTTEKIKKQNAYKKKIQKIKRGEVKTIYEDGEESVANDSDNIVDINGVKCYVLEVSEDKTAAKLITKDTYNVRFDIDSYANEKTHLGVNFDHNNVTYDYSESYLRAWMLSFYKNELGSYPKIIPSRITYYLNDIYNDNLENFRKYDLDDEVVFAIDSSEAKKYSKKFIHKDHQAKANSYTNCFWTTSGYLYAGYSKANCLDKNGSLKGINATSPAAGARPVFWISLK